MRSVSTYQSRQGVYVGKLTPVPMRLLISHAVFPFIVDGTSSVQTQFWILCLLNLLVWMGSFLFHGISVT